MWDFCYKLEEDERIIGENLYAKHSIGYKFDNIEDSFQVFCVAAKDDKDSWIYSWDSIKTCCKLLGLKTVREIYRGIYDKDKKNWPNKVKILKGLLFVMLTHLT